MSGAIKRNAGDYNSSRQRLLNDIEIDAAIDTTGREASGINCIYIPPGDNRKEYYRTATFAKYPGDVPVVPRKLSKVGFYYTGYKDRVKCFSCYTLVENWILGDNEFAPKWHKIDCLMPHGTDPSNIPTETVYPFLFESFSHPQTQTVPFQITIPPDALPDRETPVLPNINHVTSQMQRSNVGNQIRFGTIHDPAHERLLRSSNLKKEADRRKTFVKWPVYPVPHLPSSLAQNGLFYLGSLDRVQCFCCEGILRNWEINDVVEVQHRTHFSNCTMLSASNASGNIEMSEQERREADVQDRFQMQQLALGDDDELTEPPNPSPGEQLRLAQLYPLIRSATQDKSTVQARIQTFQNGWPGRIRASIEHIAKAGFFYLGESDKTKCYHCDGGLENWERNDEPWMEHAKWFPGCAFILQKKGVAYVHRLSELHPNLNRPTINNGVTYDIPPRTSNNNSEEQSTSTINAPFNIDTIRDMGFPTERIQRMMRRRMSQDNRGYTNIQDLIDDLSQDDPENEEERNTASMQEAHSSVVGATSPKQIGMVNSKTDESKTLRTNSPTQGVESSASACSSVATREMQESLRVMQESDRCKNCMVNPTDVVCLPCGHLAACSNCAENMKRCFVCKTKVQRQMKVFRA